MVISLFMVLLMLGVEPELQTVAAPRHGVTVQIPKSWDVVVREREGQTFVALIAQDDPAQPGAMMCEIGLAPETLDAYRTRIDAADRGPNPPPGKLVRNEIVKTARGPRLESVREFRAPGRTTWREETVRILKNRQMYTFLLNADEKTYTKVKPLFDASVAGARFSDPETGAERIDAKSNRWAQREYKFAIDLPEGWKPVLAPSEVALLYANGPAHEIWSDNALVVARAHQDVDLQKFAEVFPEKLRAQEPGCEVVSCELVKQGGATALETVVRTRRGPFSMTVLERRFRGDRFDYEVKYTVESKRFDALAPAMRKSLESFRELPGDVPDGKARKVGALQHHSFLGKIVTS